MTRLERGQKIAFWIAVVSAALGFVTSAGCRALPALPALSLWLLHPLLLAAGAVACYLALARGEEIDRERWRVVDDPALTSGERDYAHHRAERLRRWANTSYVAAPLMLGYWMAYQVTGEGRRLAAQLLPATALVGSVLGGVAVRLAARRGARGEPPSQAT